MSTRNEITEGVIWKQVLLFFVPILAGTFFQHFYSIVDAIIVGRGLGSAELAAVGGSAVKLIAMVTNFFIGISIGITAYVSRSFGENNFQKLKAIIYNGHVLFLSMGFVIVVLSFVYSREFLELLDTPADNMELSETYLRTYMSGMLFCVVYNLLAGVFRAMGDAKRPLYVLIFCCLLNIILDILLALVLGWGVFGIAIATVFSQGVSAVILIYMLVKQLKETEKYIPKLDFALMKDIAALGIPAGIQSMLASVSNMAVQSAINSFGSITVAAWAAFIRLDGIVDAVLSSLSATVVTFVGQNLGAGNMNRVKQSVRQITLIAFIMMPVLVAIFLLARIPLLSLFTADADIVRVGAQFMIVVLPMYICTIPQYILSQAVRALGKSFIPMVLGLFGSVGLRLFWIYVILPLNPTEKMLGISYPIISLIMSVLFFLYYKYEIKNLEKR